MGLFSWPAASSSSSPSIPPPPCPATPARPTPAATPSADPSSSSSLPPRKPRRRRRDQIPSNGPTYIFTAAGIAFTVGLLISVRQVRKLKVAAVELSRKTALAEANALSGSALALEGAAEVPKIKRIGTSSILSPGGGKSGVLSMPIAKGTWALTPPPTFLPPASKSTKVDPTSSPPSPILPPPAVSPPLPPILPSPSPPKIDVSPPVDAPPSSSSPAPLFPPSKTRPIPTLPPPTIESTSPSSTPPSTLLGLLKAGTAPDPEEPPAPPSDPKVILYGFGALGIATVIALTVVALPAAAFCWWLGVEKPSQFRPLLELKLPGLIPSLPPALVRRASPDSPNPSLVPSQLHWAKDEDWEEDDDGDEGDEEFIGDATWGDWWARLKEEFEEDRREEEERKRRSVVEELGRKEV